jgi:hypothetical protein
MNGFQTVFISIVRHKQDKGLWVDHLVNPVTTVTPEQSIDMRCVVITSATKDCLVAAQHEMIALNSNACFFFVFINKKNLFLFFFPLKTVLFRDAKRYFLKSYKGVVEKIGKETRMSNVRA